MRRNSFGWEECLPLRGKWLARLTIAIILVPQVVLIALTLHGFTFGSKAPQLWKVWNVIAR